MGRDIIRGISLNYNFLVVVKVLQDWNSSEYLLEGLKGLGAFIGPDKICIFPG
jgi:hypothetical protein